MSDNSSVLKTSIILPVGLMLVLLASATLYVIYKQQTGGDIHVKLLGFETTLKLNQREKGQIDLLKEIMSDPNKRLEAINYLQESQRLFSLQADGSEATALVNAIRSIDAGSEFAAQLRGLLTKSEGPFERSSHQFYDINDPDIVPAIVALGYENEVVTLIREREFNKPDSVFKPRIETARLALLELEDQTAAVCQDSRYRGKQLLLFLEGRSVSVSARVYECQVTATGATVLNGKIIDADITINSKTARQLLGESQFIEPLQVLVVPTENELPPQAPSLSDQLATNS